MRSTFLVVLAMCITSILHAQNPVGKWKKISHISEYEGKKFDSHSALLQSRPCAANVIWEINADGTFRLDASKSGCDEKYKNIQERLWAKTKWKLVGNKFTTSATNFAVGQTYIISTSGNKLIMTGTDNQGTITYQKL
ncbi:MAG: lipocalin family protein [Chitinophagaceae bacterium]|nr:lipocalin family protein [Chitinophagaceae bacterium]